MGTGDRRNDINRYIWDAARIFPIRHTSNTRSPRSEVRRSSVVLAFGSLRLFDNGAVYNRGSRKDAIFFLTGSILIYVPHRTENCYIRTLLDFLTSKIYRYDDRPNALRSGSDRPLDKPLTVSDIFAIIKGQLRESYLLRTAIGGECGESRRFDVLSPHKLWSIALPRIPKASIALSFG